MQYPLVEIATAVTFAIIGGANIPLPLIIIALPVACLLIAIFVYDLYYMLIPDAWAYGCAGVALLSALVGWWVYGIGQLLYILIAGPLAALPLFVLWAVSRGRWMGLGDPKLALSFGWLLGISSGLYAVFAAFVIGAVVSVALMLITSEKGKRLIARVTHRRLSSLREGGFTMRSEVPFGPFLIASCFLTWFANLYGIPLPFFPW